MIHRYVLRDRKKELSDERVFEVILFPVLTEKSTFATERGQYVFKVLRDANKFEISRAVEKLFKVEVSSVNTISVPGKVKRFRGRLGKRSASKKAVVTLREGFSIDMTTAG
jgi:large subunit ribosomal protein L23